MKFEDIHLSDRALLEQFRTLWKQGSYDAAFDVLKQTQLEDKQIIADTLNYLMRQTEALEQQSDPTFKQDKIKVSEEPPASIETGKLWFKIEV